MKLIIEIEKDYYELIKYSVEHGDYYKLYTIIANGKPYEESTSGDLISRNALKEEIIKKRGLSWKDMQHILCISGKEIDDVPTVEPEELKEVRNICEHWNDKSSSFESACNAFENILHVFKLGVGDM